MKNITHTEKLTMSASGCRLDQRILTDYEFTLRDEVVAQLLDIIRCLIHMKEGSANIIFREQCFNKESWIRWLDEANT